MAESAGCEYMLAGSVAMNYYSQPRTTRDIDIVSSLVENDSRKIVGIFQGDCCVSTDAVVDAAKQHTMFSVVHLESVVRIDSGLRPSPCGRTQRVRASAEFVSFGSGPPFATGCAVHAQPHL